MTLKINNSMAISACNTLVDNIDSGAGTAKLIIYDGAVPADLSEGITTQTALVTFDLPNPAFGDAADQGTYAEAVANAIADTTADADGTATFFRILDRDAVEIIQGDVTDTAGNGDLKLSSTSVITGIDVIVVSLTARMPKG